MIFLATLRRWHVFLFALCFLLSNIAHAIPPQIIVAYPPDNKTVAFDHVLLSGSVPRGATLKIDDRVLDVAPDGLFIEWQPLTIGANIIQLDSAFGGETVRREVRVTRTVANNSTLSTSSITNEKSAEIVIYPTPRVGIITAETMGLGVNASTTAIRNGAKRSHVLQLQNGAKFVVIGEDGETFRCALSTTQTVNVLKSQMQLLPIETASPRVYFSRIETRKVKLQSNQVITSSTRSSHDSISQNASTLNATATNATSSTRSSSNATSNIARNATQIRFDLPARVPFQIEQTASQNNQNLDVRLFNTESDVDYLVSAFPDDLVESVTWRQESDGVFLAHISLQTQQQWGFFAQYENNTLVLTIKNAPPIARRKPLNGLRVLVDAGHGGSESGAPGAFGVDEKDINLKIALRLAELLKKRGAMVILSRDKDVTVPLYDRPLLAESVGADIVISIHANALPDGASPFESRGAGVYYFQPQSRALAETLMSSLLRDLPDVGNDGLHYQNLALTRPSTQLSVLVETAFMTDKSNLRTLMSETGRERFAQSLARGLETFARAQHVTSSTR